MNLSEQTDHQMECTLGTQCTHSKRSASSLSVSDIYTNTQPRVQWTVISQCIDIVMHVVGVAICKMLSEFHIKSKRAFLFSLSFFGNQKIFMLIYLLFNFELNGCKLFGQKNLSFDIWENAWIFFFFFWNFDFYKCVNRKRHRLYPINDWNNILCCVI